MKIKYKFATETVEVDVDEQWATVIADLDRQDYNNQHKETRRHYSLDACTYEGADFAVEDTALMALFEDNSVAEKLPEAIASLLPRQRELIKKAYVENRSYADIAREEGLDRSSVRQATERAIKSLKKKLL